MVIYTPVINNVAQPQQAIPYGEIKRISRSNGVTKLEKLNARGAVVISETLTAIKAQSMRNDMILVTQHNPPANSQAAQFLLPMQQIKQLVRANNGAQTQIFFNDEDNSLVVIETIAQIQTSNGQSLPVNNQSFPNTWFVDSLSGNDATGAKGDPSLPFQNIQTAILQANLFYVAQGQGSDQRQNVIVYAGKYAILDDTNTGQNFLVRDGVDTYCHDGVVIKFLETDSNLCTEPFYDNGATVISSFKGYAEIVRAADLSNGTKTITNSGSEIDIEIKTYFGSAFQLNEGVKFWFKADKFTNPFTSSVAALSVDTAFLCNIKYNVKEIVIDNSCSFVFVFGQSIDLNIDFSVGNIIISGSSQIQLAVFLVFDNSMSTSNFFVGKISQLSLSSYSTIFFQCINSIIQNSNFVCQNYNNFCGAFFDISDTNTFDFFNLKISGNAIKQQLASQLVCNQRILVDLDVNIIESNVVGNIDLLINSSLGSTPMKTRITGRIKTFNSNSVSHYLFGASTVYPTYDVLACLWNLQIFTQYASISESTNPINIPCFNVLSNVALGANTTALIEPILVSNTLSL